MAQIGTIKVQTQNSGAVSLPVYDLADFGSNVHDVVRVQTASGVGAIPFVAPADASRPYLRIQTQNNGVLAAHDKASLLTVLDSFEDNDISEYSGLTSDWSTTTTRVYDGSYALKQAAVGDGASTRIIDTNTATDQGNIYSAYINMETNVNQAGMMFGTTTGSDAFGGTTYEGYIAYQNNAKQEFRLGTSLSNTLAKTAQSYIRDKWLKIRVEWNTDDSIYADLIDPSDGTILAQVNTTDTTFTSGGIGWFGGEDSAYFDHYVKE